MMPVNANQSDADLDRDAMEEMAKHGITCAQVSLFFYGDYRYTKLAAAVAEAKRNPRAD
jgi:cytosine/adenosine deaminase-related metal-dependent hydrolase